MLHASISETGDKNEVVLRKRKRLREKLRKIVDALRRDLLNFRSFHFGFLEFRLADVEAGKSGRLLNFSKRAGGEGEEISADGPCLAETSQELLVSCPHLRFGGCVRDRRPVPRGGELQAKTAFQIRLIEARKGHLRVHGNKQSVNVLRVVVLVLEARDGFSGCSDRRREIQADRVFSGMDGAGGQLNVPAFDYRLNQGAVDGDVCCRTFAKIQKNRSGNVGVKLQILVARRGGRVGSQCEAQVVPDVGELSGPLAGEFTGDAVGRR